MYRIEDFKRIPDVIDPDSPVAWPSCVEHTPTGQRYGCCSVGPIVLDADGRRSEEVECDSELWRMLRRCMNEPPEPEHESEPAYSPVTAFANALRVELAQRVSALNASAVRFAEAGANPTQQLAAADELLAFENVINRLEALHNEA